ncbi:YbgA family protein [Microbulbifer sp. TYP-18]|uniref:YbgA family protein n=1 Tax=Microbulbifer sp. TYP-18 TaxID=3230024 RepID=UPI0034C6B6CD
MKIELLVRRIPVGISQCAMGDPVRYNAGHKHSKVCTELLSRCFEFVPLCPEVAIGLGVPRDPIRLVKDDSSPDAAVRALGVVDESLDVTRPLRAYADQVAPRLQSVRGYILMQNSPSCGLAGVRRYLPNGHGIDSGGTGVFAQRLRELFPHLPMEEVGRLNNSEIRENFLTRVFAYDAWFRYVGEPVGPARVIEFFTAYKYLLLAHHQHKTRELGQLLANVGALEPNQLGLSVLGHIMDILSHPASRKDRTNALMHVQGHLKHYLNRSERAELTRLIDDYRQGLKPVSAVLTLLRHYLPRSPHQFIHSQLLLAAEPAELGLCDFH